MGIPLVAACADGVMMQAKRLVSFQATAILDMEQCLRDWPGFQEANAEDRDVLRLLLWLNCHKSSNRPLLTNEAHAHVGALVRRVQASHPHLVELPGAWNLPQEKVSSPGILARELVAANVHIDPDTVGDAAWRVLAKQASATLEVHEGDKPHDLTVLVFSRHRHCAAGWLSKSEHGPAMLHDAISWDRLSINSSVLLARATPTETGQASTTIPNDSMRAALDAAAAYARSTHAEPRIGEETVKKMMFSVASIWMDDLFCRREYNDPGRVVCALAALAATPDLTALKLFADAALNMDLSHRPLLSQGGQGVYSSVARLMQAFVSGGMTPDTKIWCITQREERPVLDLVAEQFGDDARDIFERAHTEREMGAAIETVSSTLPVRRRTARV